MIFGGAGAVVSAMLELLPALDCRHFLERFRMRIPLADSVVVVSEDW
jgi:hypothetical protein